jgi:DNA-binding FadR family transcriptional regulator
MPASRTIIGRRPARSESRQGQRTFEQVAERIREQLAAGALTAGDKLPTERDMAEHFQVGRNAVREALRTLEMAGVIRLEKGRNGGAYICPPSSIRVTVAMRDLLNFGSISLDEIAESRTMLMDVVTRVVCERATPADLDAL